jgi:hypothetical protein
MSSYSETPGNTSTQDYNLIGESVSSSVILNNHCDHIDTLARDHLNICRSCNIIVCATCFIDKNHYEHSARFKLENYFNDQKDTFFDIIKDSESFLSNIYKSSPIYNADTQIDLIRGVFQKNTTNLTKIIKHFENLRSELLMIEGKMIQAVQKAKSDFLKNINQKADEMKKGK